MAKLLSISLLLLFSASARADTMSFTFNINNATPTILTFELPSAVQFDNMYFMRVDTMGALNDMVMDIPMAWGQFGYFATDANILFGHFTTLPFNATSFLPGTYFLVGNAPYSNDAALTIAPVLPVSTPEPSTGAMMLAAVIALCACASPHYAKRLG